MLNIQTIQATFKLDEDEAAELVGWINGVNSPEQELFEKLFAHYTMNGEMPYGIAKARTGDPQEWIFNKLCETYRDS